MFITKLHSQLKICSIFLLTIALIKLSHANENEENVDEDGEESGETEAIEGEKGKGNESGDQAYYTDANGNPVTYEDGYGYEDGGGCGTYICDDRSVRCKTEKENI